MPSNHNEDSYNFHSLQEDAIRRAREMQARARLSPFDSPGEERAAEPEPSQPREEQVPSSKPSSPNPPALSPENNFGEERTDDPTAGLLDTLLKDNERTLIWVLLLILLEEKADTALILALMYLAS
jgi:hypothetical protein